MGNTSSPEIQILPDGTVVELLNKTPGFYVVDGLTLVKHPGMESDLGTRVYNLYSCDPAGARDGKHERRLSIYFVSAYTALGVMKIISQPG